MKKPDLRIIGAVLIIVGTVSIPLLPIVTMLALPFGMLLLAIGIGESSKRKRSGYTEEANTAGTVPPTPRSADADGRLSAGAIMPSQTQPVTQKTEAHNMTSEEAVLAEQKRIRKLLAGQFKQSVYFAKYETASQEIQLCAWADTDDEANAEETLVLKINQYGPSYVKCTYTNFKSSLKFISSAEIPDHYFAVFAASELIEIIRELFGRRPCLRCSGVTETGRKELNDFLSDYRERCAEQLAQMDERLTPEDFSEALTIKTVFYNNSFLPTYCNKQYTDNDSLILYSSDNPTFPERMEETVLVTARRDDYFKMEAVTAIMEDGEIRIRTHRLSLPKDFYKTEDNAYNFLNNNKSKLPLLNVYNITNSNIFEWIQGQLDKIAVYKKEAVSVCVVPLKTIRSLDNYHELEITSSTDGHVGRAPLAPNYFALFDVDKLASDIAEKLSIRNEKELSDIEASLRHNKELTALFRAQRESVLLSPLTKQQGSQAKYFVDKLRNINAFHDVYHDIINKDSYDGSDGAPLYCNYIEMYDNIPVTDAVEQYLSLLDARPIFDSGERHKSYNDYSPLLLHMLNPWRYGSTYIIVNESNMTLKDNEAEAFYQYCKSHSIYLIRREGDRFYDYTFSYYLSIKISEGYGSADDAATYATYEFDITAE